MDYKCYVYCFPDMKTTMNNHYPLHSKNLLSLSLLVFENKSPKPRWIDNYKHVKNHFDYTHLIYIDRKNFQRKFTLIQATLPQKAIKLLHTTIYYHNPQSQFILIAFVFHWILHWDWQSKKKNHILRLSRRKLVEVFFRVRTSFFLISFEHNTPLPSEKVWHHRNFVVKWVKMQQKIIWWKIWSILWDFHTKALTGETTQKDIALNFSCLSIMQIKYNSRK